MSGSVARGSAVRKVDAWLLARMAADARATPRAEHDQLTRRLLVAGAAGDVAAVREILARDVIVVSDGGGAAPVGAGVARGVEEASWLVAALLSVPGLRLTLAEVNGRFGIVAHRGMDAVAVVAPETAFDRITAVWVVRNPAKLRAWHRRDG